MVLIRGRKDLCVQAFSLVEHWIVFNWCVGLTHFSKFFLASDPLVKHHLMSGLNMSLSGNSQLKSPFPQRRDQLETSPVELGFFLIEYN